MSSHTDEGFVECTGADPYKPALIAQCPSFESAGVQLEREHHDRATAGG